jgi:signal transduction histidine kinase
VLRPGPATGDDRLAPFASAILATRLGALTACLVLAIPDIALLDTTVVVPAIALSFYTGLRIVHPLRFTSDAQSVMLIGVEIAVAVLAVDASGGWDSPFVFSLVTAVAIAGFAGGAVFGAASTMICTLAVTLPDYLGSSEPSGDILREAGQWAAELMLVALVAGYARRINSEATQQQSLTMDRLERLAEANALLFSLHRVAQVLPASLDLQEVLESTSGRLGELFDFDCAVLLLPDEVDSSWHVAKRTGHRVSGPLAAEALPPPVQRAMSQVGPVNMQRLAGNGGPGLCADSASGLYAGLWARGSLVGLIAIEHDEPGHYRDRDVDLLEGFVEPAALAVDNARWFSRLRTVGADEERTRIARDLHDRIGQSLAYLAFELDRMLRSSKGTDLEPALDQLRNDVRNVIREVRDTLYDLRTDVSETKAMSTTLGGFLDRVRQRSGLEITLSSDERARLPLPQEREMWRIAQEAVTNVERHAEAKHVTIEWFADGSRAELVIADDGAGFPQDVSARIDSYGIIGMRERAASIGARLDIESAPGGGTTIRCQLVPS